MYNSKKFIIFTKPYSEVSFGNVKFASSSDTTFSNYYESDDYKRRVPKSDAELATKKIDFTTLNVKPGEKIYYKKLGVETQAGTIQAVTDADTITMTAACGDDIYNKIIKNGYVKLYVIKNRNVTYSYPCDRYVGASTKGLTQVSFFFERTSGKVDEVIVDTIGRDYGRDVIRQVQKDMKDAKQISDIILDTTYSSKYNLGIDKVSNVISSIKRASND